MNQRRLNNGHLYNASNRRMRRDCNRGLKKSAIPIQSLGTGGKAGVGLGLECTTDDWLINRAQLLRTENCDSLKHDSAYNRPWLGVGERADRNCGMYNKYTNKNTKSHRTAHFLVMLEM
jgi:hypothetical protein